MKASEEAAEATVRGTSLIVPVRQIRTNEWNYNQQDDALFAKLVSSIRRHGFTTPVIVRAKRKDVYEVIDGEHRLKAAMALGLDEVPIVDLGKVPDARAKELTILLNEITGEPDEARLGLLLRDISVDLDFPDLEAIMPWDGKELTRLLSDTVQAPVIPIRGDEDDEEYEEGDEPAIKFKRLTFQLAPKLHEEVLEKLGQLGKDMNDVLVKAVRAYHRERTQKKKERKPRSTKKKQKAG